MLDRRITLTRERAGRVGKHGRPWTLAIAALVVLAMGVVIGSRIGSHDSPATGSAPARQTSSDIRPATTPAPSPDHAIVTERTEAGAVDAAAAALLAFDTDVVFDDQRLEATVAAVAARDFQLPLLESYRQGATLLRERLAVDSVPRPVFFVTTAPVGYRVERYSDDAATIAVWNVGVIGSGATLQPQQSWSTQHVSLRWEDDAWKVTGFKSEPGPTPPLGRADTAAAPSELFETVPTFKAFDRATR